MSAPRISRRNARDAGVTLVEIVIAVVLSGIVAGVIVSSLITSLNAVDSTTEMVASSTDQALIATYLYRDAQAAAGTDPATARVESGAGVGVASGGADWGGCTQDGEFVVRFSWIDRSATTDIRAVTTWSLHPDGGLVRRSCDAAGSVDLVLGREIGSVVAVCSPDPACGGEPATIALSVRTGTRTPSEFTLTASLRGDLQVLPGTDRAAPVPLLVLGEQSATGACPVLDLVGTGTVTVLGGVIVSANCGASPVAGDQTLLAASGTTSILSGVSDPYESLLPPTDDCTRSSRLRPGASPDDEAVVVHTARVVLSGTISFSPGRHVFCAGLTLTADAVVSGTGVLWYLPSGRLVIDPAASVDLTAATTGDYANLLVWIGGTDGVSIGGDAIGTYRGVLYAPSAKMTLSSSTAVHVGGVVAAEVAIAGRGAPRLGLPIPTLAATPTLLPAGQVGVTYPTTPIVGGGGTAPYRYTADGLPTGLTLSAGGAIAGTPTASGTFTVSVLVIDATGVHRRFAFPLTIRVPVSISGPAALPDGQAGTAFATTTFAATGGLAPYSWAASGLPAGMTLSSSGQLRGTPSAAGRYTVNVTVADTAAGVATRAYTTTIAAISTTSNPFTPTQRFQLVTEGDATLGSFGMDGAAAVGGNLTFRNYHSVATIETSTLVRTAQPAGLVVGGMVDLAGSAGGNQLTVGTGFLHLGGLGSGTLTTWGTRVHLAPAGVIDDFSTPRLIVAADQSNQTVNPVVLPGAFDTASAFADFRTSSSSIAVLDPATCPAIAAPTVTSAFGNYTLTLVSGRLNVWNLTLAQITAMGNVNGPTNANATTPLVINVTDSGTITLPARYWTPLQNGTKSAIMWNFPNATALNVSGSFYGSMLAPNASVTIDNVTIEGDVVARTARLTSGRYALAHWTTAIPCTLGALSVYGPPTIADGQVGVASSATMTGSGGAPGYAWSAAGLPPGLTMSTVGVLAGAPTTAGVYTIVATVTDSVGATAGRSFTLTVRAAPAVASPASLPAGSVGNAFTTTTFAVSGGLAPFAWSASGVPAGLVMSTGGQLSGTPTANGTSTVTVSLRDAAGATATRTYALTVTGVVCPTITGWKGEYFDNMTLTGPAVLCRNDTSIAFDWGEGSPDPRLKPENFSARWTQKVSFTAGSYRFTAGADDGLRLYVDGTLVLDSWYDQSHTTHQAIVELAEGGHEIVYETYENFGDAAATLTWSPIIPASCPKPKADEWTMEIYDGTSLSGPMVDCKNESALKYDWGSGSPDSEVGDDTFSIRWTRTWTFVGGTYEFVAGSDDGVRVWVDGALVIDAWRHRSYATTRGTISLARGTHTVIMEYYENGGDAAAALAINRV